jgi:hypothetical protein
MNGDRHGIAPGLRLLAAGAFAATLLFARPAPAQPSPASDARRPKKLIATGWDSPDTGRLREHHVEMEQRPFDGVVFHVVGRDDDDKPRHLRWAFLDEPWRYEWFEAAVEDVRACRFERFTDNFVQFLANPGNVDWFDDDGWRNIVDHWRIAARVAKRSGAKGIIFDPEPYAPPHSQFAYSAQPRRAEHTFAEYQAQARLRGRQIIEAVAAEYPDITLFCYFLNSVNTGATRRRDPAVVLATSVYGLLPAMLDGWLDAAPASITFVDGCESAYRYNSSLEYLDMAVRIKGDCQELVSPENRAKYRTAVQVSYGIYLDAYWNPPDSPWYIDGLGGERVDRLRANVQTALRAADEYVWVYGEKFRWWPTPNRSVREETWPEALPGSEDALRFARDPAGFARGVLAAVGTPGAAANLVHNGDFAAERLAVGEREETWREGGRPVGWSAWQDERSQGTFTWDRDTGRDGKGSARAAGVAAGCFLQHHEVEPGERYAVRAFRRLDGEGRAWLRVRWQTPEGRWTAEMQDVLAFPDGPDGEWVEMLAVVEVPPGVGRLVVLLSVGDQASEGDAAWFDDAALCRLP